MTRQLEALMWEIVRGLIQIDHSIRAHGAEAPAVLHGLIGKANEACRLAADEAHHEPTLALVPDAPANPPAVIIPDPPKAEYLDRNTTIKRIREALKKRSGRAWSVTGGRGTAWGWLTIDAPPARRKFNSDGTPATEGGHMHPDEQKELADLLGLKDPVHFQGVSIPSGGNYYAEYVDRAEGRTPEVYGEIYWD